MERSRFVRVAGPLGPLGPLVSSETSVALFKCSAEGKLKEACPSIVLSSPDAGKPVSGAARMKKTLPIVAAVLTLSIIVGGALGKTSPKTGRIRLLYVGQWPYVGRPQYLVEDPLLETSIIPYHDFGAQLDQIRRYMYQRYPRTPKFLDDNYDVVAYANIQLLAFTARQIRIVADGVKASGLGFWMSGGHTSFGGTTDVYPTWRGSAIDGILPVEVIDGIYKKNVFFKLAVSDPKNELMASLPWSSLPPFTYTLNAVTMRQEGKLLAQTDPGQWPLIACGDYGKGRVLAFMTPLNAENNRNMWVWGYYDDMCANMVYYCAKAKLPDNPAVIHELRRLFRSYSDERLLFLSMVEFVDKFGANTARLEDRLSHIDSLRKESYAAYVSQEYEVSAELMKEAMDKLKAGRGEAVRVKNAALLWVYVVEWFVVTAALMVTGSIVWTLMVRRRLYKEVRTTRPVPRTE